MKSLFYHYLLSFLVLTLVIFPLFFSSAATVALIKKNLSSDTVLVVANPTKPSSKQNRQKKKSKPVSSKTSSKKSTRDKNQNDSSVDPTIIKSLTNELNILNKQIHPRLQQKSAVKHIQNRKYHKAIDLLESLDDLSPRSLIILAEAYESNKDYENQLRVLRKLIKKDDQNGAYLLELIKALKKLYFKTSLLPYKEEAIQTIQTIYTLNKKYHERADEEMFDLLKKDDEKENKYAILKLLQKMIREFGAKQKYIKELCKYFYINQYYSQSLKGCKKAMQFFPKEPSNYVYHALSMEKTKDIEKHLLKTAEKFPQSYLAQVKTGQFLIEQKEYKTALLYFTKLIKSHPKSAEAHLGKAQSLFFTRKEAKAYKHFLKACILDKPNMLWPFRQAKSILNQKGKFKLAIRFDKGLSLCFHRGQAQTKL